MNLKKMTQKQTKKILDALASGPEKKSDDGADLNKIAQKMADRKFAKKDASKDSKEESKEE